MAEPPDDTPGPSDADGAPLDADPNHPALVPPPAGVVLRRATRDDLDAVAELYAACALDRIGVRLWRRDDLAARWRASDAPGDTLLVEDASDGRLVAYAEFHEDRDPFTSDVDLYLDARVHPAATGRGIGTFVLARAEARARRVAGGEAVALRTSLVDADDRARSLFVRLGFRPVRHFLDLRIDLDEPPPAPDWPSGIRARAVDLRRDARPVWAALQEAFADHWAFHPTSFEDWWRFAVERQEDDGALWQLAEDDRGVVGVAVVRASMPEDRSLGYISDLGVVQRARRRGVALGLLRSVFASLRERGITRVGLEVDDITLHGALRLYERAGMRVARRTDVVEKLL